MKTVIVYHERPQEVWDNAFPSFPGEGANTVYMCSMDNEVLTDDISLDTIDRIEVIV